MRFLYDLLFAAFFLFSLPCYGFRLWRRGNWRDGFGQRFGLYSAKLTERLQGKRVIWFHAVSVGEVHLCALLVRKLGKQLQDWTIVASTTTSTGMGELRRQLPENAVKIYYPIDFSWIVRRALRIIRPQIMTLVEAEIWPNLLWQLADKQVPVFLINARLSPRSAKRYCQFRALFQPIFSRLAGIAVPNKQDATILESVGCRANRIQVIGNLKFDAADSVAKPAIQPQALLQWAGAKQDAPILLGSSTHAGEERLLGEIFLRLRKDFPDLFLVMAPRHFERGDQVRQELRALGMETRLRSDFQASQNSSEQENRAADTTQGQCLVLDSTGELRSFYGAASIAVIGKSFLAQGGQNPIEAAAAGCAIVAGPFMENFQAILKTFLDKDGILQVRNAAKLETTLRLLLADDSRRQELGRRAQLVVQENQGAANRAAAMIAPPLQKR